ncbi:pyrroline-5-carboxylate reductase [Terribacillus aidingensis]|uniref:Pyrroline-5-carboxylate reductase n=1 Tax=Terribacillus aidingensis TaxID=586416 RepID=A0A285N044_9BACI|nr:pyrroline-5-carboxylate reductase [Terribacillus aidingensis]SNZ02177.1 pyrroline-5-carboxylate reductase [Terribacillus aidingensis]
MDKIAFIGAGAMTEAIVKGVIKAELLPAPHIWVTNHANEERLQRMHAVYGVTVTRNQNELLQETDIIILSVKPKDAEQALRSLGVAQLGKQQIVVSLMAGITTAYLESFLPAGQPVIRVMPNTSATILEAATAIAAGTYTDKQQLQLVKRLFGTVGSAVEVGEELMDAVTAISGSGPAYIYYLMEALEEASSQVGLDEDIGKQLLIQTFKGAAAMLEQSELSSAQLRANITSAGGTTAAGIAVLENQNVKAAVKACVQAAAVRSKEMGQAYSK